ncbi:LysR family transcriptional regulator [Longispora albida]|uniref:LysR family transcriptional regulator n=1 Tax=Longispora albida TaxID=203523 RepID=UPI00037BB6D1|nr:LysR family transcriptional regulator [Longispora albida]
MPLSPRVPDLAALDLLLSVIELGSMGRAAEAHGISQPSASSRIRYLERLIGQPVLERSTRGSRPTPAGALVAEWARAVVGAAQQLDEGIAALRDETGSHLHVAASQTIAEYLFPRWLVALRTREPGATVALRSGNSAEVAQSTLEGGAGVGFVESPVIPRGLQAHAVGTDTLTIVAATPTGPLTPAELAAAPMILREPGSGTRIAFEEAMRAVLPGWQPAPVLELSSTTAIKTAAGAGAGLAVVSSLAVAAEIASGALHAVTVPGLDLRRTLHAVWPRSSRLTGLAATLYAIARS